MKSISFQSPIGRITVVEKEGEIVRIKIGGDTDEEGGEQSKLLSKARQEILQYLLGKRKDFTLPYSLKGLTEFQRQVFEIVKSVRYGSWTTYGEIAKILGKEGAARAVGQALKRNPLLLIIPCHRVKRTKGDLGDFSGGGPVVKKFLLDLERKNSVKEDF